jgi:2-keto-4-pentenoate hydratase/2-oxohepta-3-ene-1,7-dioic acid hydratase in catechol pathway
MKKNTYIKIFISSVIFLFLCVFSYQYFNKINNTDIALPIIPKVEAPSPESDVSGNKLNTKTYVPINIKEVVEISDTNKVDIRIIVDGKNYDAHVTEGQSVYQAMIALSSVDKEFVFTAKDYSGMGMFIDSINGVYGSAGKYWIYYINDKKASIGVSKNFLKSGDVIRWEREGLIN